MVKRKSLEEKDIAEPIADQSDDSGDEDEEIVNVDFDFFDPKEIDYQAFKNLGRQLLDADSVRFDLSSLADLLVKSIGTTIKTDGEESDPFAVLSLIEMKDLPSELKEYFIEVTKNSLDFNREIRRLTLPKCAQRTGFLFSERLINMPSEIVPPLYSILQEELEKAKEKYDYFLLLSKAFTEKESEVDEIDSRPSKKGRTVTSAPELFYFHQEDPVIHEVSEFQCSYKFSKEVQNSDSKRAFQSYGIYPMGHLILFKADKLDKLVDNLKAAFPA